MRRPIGFGLLVATMALAAVAVPAAAAERHQITIDAVTTFDDVPDAFTADGIAGCDWGIVENGPANVRFTPVHGVFAGFKVFWCEGSTDDGFVLRLNALFGPGGSVGTWSVVDAWGNAAGMTGAGKLWGEPIDNGIIDHYAGTTTVR
jgi:hypothetical protein